MMSKQKPAPKKPAHLVVHTVQLEKPRQKQIAALPQPHPPQKQVTSPAKATKPKSQPIPAQKTTPPTNKPIPAPKPAAPKSKPKASAVKTPPKPTTAKPDPKPTENQANLELLALMEQSLVGLEKVKQKSSVAPSATKVGKLKSETLSETTYQQMLVSYLQERLQFPENGEVKIKLTVSRTGSIEKSIVMTATSASNERYIHENLRDITLPAFGSNFKGESEHTFSLTLTSR